MPSPAAQILAALPQQIIITVGSPATGAYGYDLGSAYGNVDWEGFPNSAGILQLNAVAGSGDLFITLSNAVVGGNAAFFRSVSIYNSVGNVTFFTSAATFTVTTGFSRANWKWGTGSGPVWDAADNGHNRCVVIR